MLETQAWVLYRGERRSDGRPEPGRLMLETFRFREPTEEEVLAEPLYGCWEGNMSHALERVPVDVCRFRREEKVVLGNAGVVRVVRTGSAVTSVQPGDICLVFGNAEPDAQGYMVKALAYDAADTMGVLAKQIRLHARNLIRIPPGSRHSLKQWAAFSLRYITAWSNWRLAYGCWRLQMTEADRPVPFVVGWGGGVSYAQLLLAKLAGCRVAMISSQAQRLRELATVGILPIDRRHFPDLSFEPERYASDLDYKKRYVRSEKSFLALLEEAGQGQDVDIFLDHLGAPVYPATLKALGRQGVIATAGWKHGAELLNTSRSSECISRHQHIHTHYARYSEGVAATAFAENTGWLPAVDQERVYPWEEVPQLVEDYTQGRLSTYFPLFQINPE